MLQLVSYFVSAVCVGCARDTTIHCWEGGQHCDASNTSPEIKPCKFELLSQVEVLPKTSEYPAGSMRWW